MIRPLAAWLSGRSYKPARTLWWGLGIGALTLSFGTWAWLNADLVALGGLTVAGLAVMLITPLAAAALAGVLTALEVRGEQFQFVLLTNVRERLIVEGCIAAALDRTRLLRAAAAGMIPGLVIGLLAELLRILTPLFSFPSSYTSTQVRPPNIALPGLFLAFGLALLWGTHLIAVRVGVALALRYRSPALAAALGPGLLLASVLLPLLLLMLPSFGILLCPIGAYLYFRAGQYVLGHRLIQDARHWVREVDV